MSRKINELIKKYNTTRTSIVTVRNIDPTSHTNKDKYLDWLCKMRYVKNEEKGKYYISKDFPASLIPEVGECLTWFNANINGKVPVENRDINSFTDIKTFITKIKELSTPSISEIKKMVRVVLDDDNFKVLVPLTYESSKLYGSGTKWCTTQKQTFKNYTDSVILYYIIDKNTNRKFGLPISMSISTPNRLGFSFYNNEDKCVRYDIIHSIYGDFFNVVIESVLSDFKTYMDKINRDKFYDNVIYELNKLVIKSKSNGYLDEKLFESLIDTIKTKKGE